jgi:hypothetical protein
MTRRKHLSQRLANSLVIQSTNALAAAKSTGGGGHTLPGGGIAQGLNFSFERANDPISIVRDYAAGALATLVTGKGGIG